MKDKFQKNMDLLLEVITSKPDHKTIIISIFMACLFAAVMWSTYRIIHDKKTYDSKFAVTLVVLALISTILMDLIQSNLALSLGMLGSLSIVRFRTNIKDPRDIGFIFWSMAIGIAAATGSYAIGIAGCIVIGTVMIITKNKAACSNRMMLVVRGSNTDLDRLQDIVNKLTSNSSVRAKNVLEDSFEVVYEMEITEDEGNNVIGNIFELGGIDSVNLLAQNG